MKLKNLLKGEIEMSIDETLRIKNIIHEILFLYKEKVNDNLNKEEKYSVNVALDFRRKDLRHILSYLH